jgi:hypothetical protein
MLKEAFEVGRWEEEGGLNLITSGYFARFSLKK